MTTTFAKGDTVILKALEATVNYVNSNSVDLELSGSGAFVDCVPLEAVALIRKAAPAEPALGSVITYKNGVYGGAVDYIRTASGWRRLEFGMPTGMSFVWGNFTPSKIHLHAASPKALVG